MTFRTYYIATEKSCLFEGDSVSKWELMDYYVIADDLPEVYQALSEICPIGPVAILKFRSHLRRQTIANRIEDMGCTVRDVHRLS